MPGLRNGKDYHGLSENKTVLLYRSIQLNGFRLADLVRPAQHMQEAEEARLQEMESTEPEPPIQHSSHPLAPTEYIITPLADLAKHRPKPRISASNTHQIRPYLQPTSRNKKRALERSARRKLRAAEQERLGTGLKAFQRAHIQQTRKDSIRISFDASQVLQESPIWTGNRNDEGVVNEAGFLALDEVLSIPGMQLLRHDGSDDLLLHDENDNPVAFFSKPLLSTSEQQKVDLLFQQVVSRLDAVRVRVDPHRRGNYFTKAFGISFGGGQQRPGTFQHCKSEEKVWAEFSNAPEVRKLARLIDYLFKCYFPHLHSLYQNVLHDLCKSDPDLARNWNECSFAASSLNLLSAVTKSHRDYLNLLFGQCAIYNTGTFDHVKGGHLILWDLKMVVQFPPGCLAFIPSAMIRHSNASILPNEVRHSLTFFTASGLFRWRHNNYMTDKSFKSGAPKDKLKEWKVHRNNLWKVGLDLLKVD